MLQIGPKIAQLQGQILDSLSMQIGVDDMMKSKLREVEKQRDNYDVKYETSRFEAMIGFGTETAFDAKQKELEEINLKKFFQVNHVREWLKISSNA